MKDLHARTFYFLRKAREAVHGVSLWNTGIKIKLHINGAEGVTHDCWCVFGLVTCVTVQGWCYGCCQDSPGPQRTTRSSSINKLVPNQHWGPHQLSCPSAVSASGCWKDVPFPFSAAKIKDGIYLNPAMKGRIAENIKLFLPPGYDKKNTHGISSVSPSYGIFKYQNPDLRVPNTWLSIKLMRFFFFFVWMLDQTPWKTLKPAHPFPGFFHTRTAL